MSKLDEIAQTLKSDTATSEELYSMNSAQLAMRFITLREWMREVLPVALAAEALCTPPFDSETTLPALRQALKEIES